MTLFRWRRESTTQARPSAAAQGEAAEHHVGRADSGAAAEDSVGQL